MVKERVTDIAVQDGHVPVMLSEVLEAMAPKDGERHVDATFGGGGYARGILNAASCHLVAFDRDPYAQERAQAFAKEFEGRFTFQRDVFSNLDAHLDPESVDGIVLDIGVSSYQIDTAERGFSFQKDGPLDMRMSADQGGETAADLVNNWEESDLVALFRDLGEERFSGRIAKAIVARRQEQPFSKTLELADLIKQSVPRGKPGGKFVHPATRVFQALRIAVNAELEELETALAKAELLLKPGGRLVVVTFHSLEDRIVKQFFKDKAGGARKSVNRYRPQIDEAEDQPVFSDISRKAVKVSDREAQLNPRSRSAKLRWAIRSDRKAGNQQGGAYA